MVSFSVTATAIMPSQSPSQPLRFSLRALVFDCREFFQVICKKMLSEGGGEKGIYCCKANKMSTA